MSQDNPITEGPGPVNIDAILEERGSRYGSFSEHSRITQGIKSALQSGGSWNSLSASQKEALEMIAHKMGRIVNGDPTYLDSWVDITGYNQLVVKELEDTEQLKIAQAEDNKTRTKLREALRESQRTDAVLQAKQQVLHRKTRK